MEIDEIYWTFVCRSQATELLFKNGEFTMMGDGGVVVGCCLLQRWCDRRWRYVLITGVWRGLLPLFRSS